jgi:hypothetical protein
MFKNMLKFCHKILHCRNGIPPAPSRAKGRVTYLGESRADPRGVEGRASHQHGVEQAAQAPDVRLQAVRGPRRNFRTKAIIANLPSENTYSVLQRYRFFLTVFRIRIQSGQWIRIRIKIWEGKNYPGLGIGKL